MADGDQELLDAARSGVQDAWEALVGRHAGRVWAVARAHGLAHADASDVFQVTWLRLLTHLDRIRDADKVGAWLATTARHESLRVIRSQARQVVTGDPSVFEEPDALVPAMDAGLVRDERRAALWEAFRSLPPHCQRLLRFLMAEPEPTYADVTAALDMPLGSIGPTRRRCLEHLRRRLASITDDVARS